MEATLLDYNDDDDLEEGEIVDKEPAVAEWRLWAAEAQSEGVEKGATRRRSVDVLQEPAKAGMVDKGVGSDLPARVGRTVPEQAPTLRPGKDCVGNAPQCCSVGGVIWVVQNRVGGGY